MNEHAKLLQDWEKQPSHHKKCFIRDGILYPDKWNQAALKVVFLLKEAYDDLKRDEGYDLCESLRKKRLRNRMWRTVAGWAHVAQQLFKGTIPKPPINDHELEEALLSSAVVNVKKSHGKSRSSSSEIARYAQNDSQCIQKQIELLQPDLVICGKTWKAVKHLWKDATPLSDRVHQVNGCLFVNFWHPAIQCPAKLSYYSLAWLLRNNDIWKDIHKRKEVS